MLMSDARYIFDILGLIDFSLFLVLCVKDPGRITPANIKQYKQYPVHPELFPADALCFWCSRHDTDEDGHLMPKIPRSKHCRDCNACFARMDHHCIFLNRCIAARNFGLFIVFLGLYFLGAGYSVYLITGEFRHQLVHHELTKHTIGLVLPQWQNRFLLTVATMACLSWCIMGMFFGYQWRQVVENTTTYESYKRSMLEANVLDECSRNSSPSLDHTWGGVWPQTQDVPSNPAEDKSPDTRIAAIRWNPYKAPSVFQNIRDAFGFEVELDRQHLREKKQH